MNRVENNLMDVSEQILHSEHYPVSLIDLRLFWNLPKYVQIFLYNIILNAEPTQEFDTAK